MTVIVAEGRAVLGREAISVYAFVLYYRGPQLQPRRYIHIWSPLVWLIMRKVALVLTLGCPAGERKEGGESPKLRQSTASEASFEVVVFC